jgi:adenosine deaminase
LIASPKIELHLHLEGAAPPAFVRGMAAEKKVDLSSIFDERGNYAYRDFPDFLRVYEAATSVLTTPRDYARLTTEVLERCAEQGVIYAETFLSPDFCGGGDLAAWRDYLCAMEEAAATMADMIQLRGIVTCIRHFGPEKARAPALCAAETVGGFITGFGIAGDESTLKPRDYVWAFDCAREAGLRLTAHGVRAIEDRALMHRLAEDQITLEVCPGSNIALGVYPNWSAHPIEKLREAGVPVTVSTDDPPFFHTTMTAEYDRLADTFGWGVEEFAQINRTAVQAAFCDDVTRNALLKKLDESK